MYYLHIVSSKYDKFRFISRILKSNSQKFRGNNTGISWNLNNSLRKSLKFESDSGTGPVSIGSSQNLSPAIQQTHHIKHKRVVLDKQ